MTLDTPPAADPADDRKVDAALDAWKRKLLDLTLRNRALNFRMTKVSTVAVVDEQPAEVFRRLYLQEKPMRFRAAAEPAAGTAPGDATEPPASPPPAADAASRPSAIVSPSAGPTTVAETAVPDRPASPAAEAASTADAQPAWAVTSATPAASGSPSVPASPDGSASSEVSGSPADPRSTNLTSGDASASEWDRFFAVVEEDAEVAAPAGGAAFAPYEAAALHARHSDDVLQTTAPPELLDRALRRIDELARETVEEQGVNALFLALGMLHYHDPRKPDDVLRAPLVLLPVALARRSATTGYTVAATDDDPIVNPTLAEALKRDHGVALPELPDPATIADDYDLQTFLSAARDVAAGQDGWSVTTEIYLGLFAFQKFVMYKDLEANGAAFAAHRLIRQLVTRRGGGTAALPDEVRAMALDAEFPPELTPQVVDADASQLRAIAAVAVGNDLVLEGPPGTGKSQTITNLIAQALAAGESVLFVAEKQAALSVVHERLVKAGLGDFCLELHSTKAKKRAVLKEIGRALDATLQRAAPVERTAARLPEVRGTLTAYADAVHTPYGAAGFTPYRGFGEALALHDAPRLPLTPPVDGVTREAFDATARDLDDLAVAVGEVGDPARHPWRDSGRTLWTEDAMDEARRRIADLRAALGEAMRLAPEAEAAFGLPPVRTFADVATAARVGEIVGRSPGAPLGVLQSDAWNAPPREATELIERGRHVSALAARAGERFTTDVLQQEHAADVEFIETKENSLFRFLNFLGGRFRAVRHRWKGYRLPSYAPTLLEQAAEMRKVDELRRERAGLAARDDAARLLFGALWEGEASRWDALDAYVRWVVEFRGACVAHGLAAKAAEAAARARPDVSLAVALREAGDRAQAALVALRVLAEWPADHLSTDPLAEVAARAGELDAGLSLAPRWAAYEIVRSRVAAGLAGEMLAPATAGAVAFGDLTRAFRRAFHQKWLAAAVQEREPLRHFATVPHEQRAEEFRRLDMAVLEENRELLVARLRDTVQARLREPEGRAAMDVLRPQISRQRRHAPLRRTLRGAGAAVRAIKPCFMMSPLTVAQLLDGDAPSFDLVIFDEASQLTSEDAVGAVTRGRRLVVVGDPKQLPPTSFFAAMAGQEVPLAEDGTPLVDDAESVLEEFMAAGVPRTRLRWHYRSTHESLITFSNVSFYEADLHTFPSADTNSHGAGLVFRHVADGVYEGKGLNPVEARAVADAVVRHAKETPWLSLGVGTFNLRQQLAVLDELEARRRADPSLEPFFSREADEPFFVKNLENIQGDERDVIFLSVTYGRARDGKLRYNFGPINGENGWRRLNVLTTRARRRMEVFSSMRGDEITPSDAGSRGPQLMRDFLTYAERGTLETASAAAAAPPESAFEREVHDALQRRGVALERRVGMAGYRVEFAVRDDEVPERFVCGIECDGPIYRAAETARDRDRLRLQVLERRGWEMHRTWSVDWFKDREGQITRLIGLIDASRRRARDAAAGAVEAARTEAEAAAAVAAGGAAIPPPLPGETAAGLAARAAEKAAAASPPASVERAGDAGGATLAAAPYRRADTRPRHGGTDFLEADVDALARLVREIAEAEAPVHVDDVADRLTEMWELSRAGTRVAARIDEAVRRAAANGWVTFDDDFVRVPGHAVEVRTREEVKIPAERIAPEEYREAVLRVLRARGALPRPELLGEVRSLLGFSRITPRLEEAIGAAVDALLAEGVAGEGSAGVQLR